MSNRQYEKLFFKRVAAITLFVVTSISVGSASAATIPYSAVCGTDIILDHCIQSKTTGDGEAQCASTGLDYAPQCNGSRCPDYSSDPEGEIFAYACVKPAGVHDTPTDDVIADTDGGACEAGFERQSGVCFPTETHLPDPAGGISQILGNFLGWLFGIFAFLSVGAFVVSGIQYLIASGSDDLIKTAKNNMKWSLVGVIVGLSGWVVMQAVFNALNANPFF